MPETISVSESENLEGHPEGRARKMKQRLVAVFLIAMTRHPEGNASLVSEG